MNRHSRGTMQTMGSERGLVTLVGAGPGSPGLMTLAGARALAEADVVLFDALAPLGALRHVQPGAEVIDAGKRSGDHRLSQAEIESLIVSRALEGKKVVRLKGGDPFVFGRGGEEALACRKARVPFAVIPGVTSAIAGPAFAGIPLTHRGMAGNVLIMTSASDGTGRSPDWALAARADTLVILMGAATLDGTAAALIAAGKPAGTPAACVQSAGTGRQRVVTAPLGELTSRTNAEDMGAPMVIVVGEVASLAEELHWFEAGPLAGRTIAVMRARRQAGELTSRLEALGAEVLELPVIRTVSQAGSDEMREAMLSRPDWFAFTSVNGVESAMETLRLGGLDARSLAASSIAAVGDATAAALAQCGLRPDFQPGLATAEALAVGPMAAPGMRVVFPTSNLGNGSFARSLEQAGATVREVVAYETLPEALQPYLLERLANVDAVVFTSGSTVRSLAEAQGERSLPPAAKLASIGPSTSAVLRATFGRVDIEAHTPSIESFVEAIVEVLRWDC